MASNRAKRMWKPTCHQFVLNDHTSEKKSRDLFRDLPNVCSSPGARGPPVLPWASVSFAQPGCKIPGPASIVQSSRVLIHEGRNIERVDSDGTWRRENVVGRREGVSCWQCTDATQLHLNQPDKRTPTHLLYSCVADGSKVLGIGPVPFTLTTSVTIVFILVNCR